MYCVNCGKDISDADAFCPSCGSNVKTGLKRKKVTSFNKKSLVIILCIIAVVALILKLNQVNDVNASPENVAKAAVISEYEADIDLMVKCFPNFTIRELALEYGLAPNASRSEVKNEIKKEYRYSESYAVSNVKTEVIQIYDIDEFTFIEELYDDITDEEFEEITKIAKVKVTFEVDGESENVQATCVKIKGKWYLLRS